MNSNLFSNLDTDSLFLGILGLGAATIIIPLLLLYVWACTILGKFAASRGHSFQWWFVWSLILTPAFAPSLYFYSHRENNNYFYVTMVVPIIGLSFSFLYIPFAMFASLFSRVRALMSKE